MRRVKLTALFLIVYGSLYVAPALLLVIIAAVMFVIVGSDWLLPILQDARAIIGIAALMIGATLHVSASYLLLTYHRYGVRLAQVCFLLTVAGHVYEIFRPSFRADELVQMGLTIPAYVPHLYLAYNLISAGFFIWLIKLFDERQFRANYQIVSSSMKNLFDHLYGRVPPPP